MTSVTTNEMLLLRNTRKDMLNNAMPSKYVVACKPVAVNLGNKRRIVIDVDDFHRSAVCIACLRVLGVELEILFARLARISSVRGHYHRVLIDHSPRIQQLRMLDVLLKILDQQENSSGSWSSEELVPVCQPW